eukprot:CAMPEP_0194275790 /NCGR_PEP_ID=MMETSP0169-20130528/8551_1 /TAXON_ID=218684 /ORGANISM="Corethron pennatum, Strain L29A3" /LENGTH=223 /DNA_ID=CAMNT_0039019345 /DNA_START=61 /DNA_END=732 /DNA_ORIENTATION=-
MVSAAAKKPSPIEELLGPNILTSDGIKNTHAIMKNRDLVVLYFSASWCGPCKSFSPALANFYRTAQSQSQSPSAAGPKIEVVFVSSDQDQQSFRKYYADHPWVALPYSAAEIGKKLAADYRIKGIPSVIVLDAKTGHYVTNTGREDVLATQVDKKADPEKVRETVAVWKEKEAVPLEQANFDENKPLASRIVRIFAENPLMLFLFLYLVKRFMEMWGIGKGDK